MSLTVTVESVDESALESARWLKLTLRKLGYAKYVQVVMPVSHSLKPLALSTTANRLPEIIFFLDQFHCLSASVRQLRRRYLAAIRRDPSRYVVIDGSLSQKDQRETIWLALRAKLSHQGVSLLCHEEIALRTDAPWSSLSLIG